MTHPLRVFCTLSLAVFVAPIASAQGGDASVAPRRPIGTAGITAVVTQPLGQFETYVGTGYGVGLDFAGNVTRSGILQVRVDLGFLQYGKETKHVCLSETVGCRVTVDVNTSNDIIVGGIGPQLIAPRGAVRPYATATAGFAYFFTHSSVTGSNDSAPFADTQNFDDFVFAWTGGGGVLITLRGGSRPIFLDVAARYHHNGQASYLREGSITDNPDGSITISPIRIETNFMAYQLGVSFGF